MVSQQYLKEVFDYNPDTGVFKRKKAFSNRSKVGEVLRAKQAGGYVVININGRVYRAHRLAWMYVYGEWPEGDIDHINGVKDDNRLCNLREAERSQNLCNTRTPKTNTSGYKGVSWDATRGKWVAKLCLRNKQYPLGRFDNLEDAVLTVQMKREQLHGEYARHQ